MILDNEKRFYDALGAVPEVPPGLLRNILQRSRRPGVFYRVALAASAALAVGAASIMFVRFGPPSSAVYAEHYDPWDELIYAFEFVDGGFDGEFQLSSFIEEVFE